MSSPPRLIASSLTPNDESAGSDGGGGPFFSGFAFASTPFALGVWFSFPSGTGAIINVLFLLPNHPLLFFLDRLGLLSTVAGDPGLSDFRLSDDDNGRRPRNLRTERGRLPDGLVGDSVLLLSFVDVFRRCELAVESVDSLGGGELSSSGKKEVVGVGCESRGPLPGVGGRGVSGGESGGAGIEVPSVREKLMGVKVRGW